MLPENFTLEVCADSVDSAIIAQSGGAKRVELCNSLPEGGITPSLAQIEIARKLLSIKLYVLIRPRGGDFLYNNTAFEIMKSDIRHCGAAGCDGVVIGMLNADGRIDAKRCGELIATARLFSMGVTFHRAFDRCRNPEEALETVIQLGCERILTSGGKSTALEGTGGLKRLVEKASGRISIMPGAGITPDNAVAIVKATGVHELHGTFRSRYPGEMIYKNTAFDNEEEYTLQHADIEKIKQVINSIQETGFPREL